MESPFKESRKVSIDNKIINVNSQLDTEGSVLAQMIDTSNENKPQMTKMVKEMSPSTKKGL